MSRLIMSTAMLSLVVVLLASVATIAEAQQTTDDPSSSNQSGAGENPDQPDQSGQSGDSVAENAEPGDETAAEPRIIRAKDKNHPFQVRIGAPDFPRDAEWLNTGGPIRMKDLKGKFVILDFWTYCCINCIHILPELKKLEHKYPKNLVVIGVHSAKFDTEKGAKNISEAVLRYEIEHPVVNDPEHRIWNSFGVSSWPSIVLIDPEGNFVGRNSGEFKAEDISPLLDRAITYYRKNDLLDESAVHFDQLAAKQ
ncbi:MAG: thioredoxin-like domain-containing protein, partial [bacterium]|nr:thioredoxin-like domain-containing protein [bacterium]